MNTKTLRNTVFYLHRWIGLAVGLVAIVIGLTGSLLVFEQDFDRWMVAQQYGSITPLAVQVSPRKLTAGFKIKRNAHPKRVSFDIHKVAGVVAVVFLFLTAFTGCCWNFYSVTEPIIYAMTFTQKPPDVLSKAISGQSPLSLTKQLSIADAALPGAITRSIYFPDKPEDALRIRRKLPQETISYGNSNVYLDQYNGEVLRVDNGLKLPLGDRILNSFAPLHYGTFGGLSTRILYVFVGLAPLILFITGFVMWWYRRRDRLSQLDRGDRPSWTR